MRNDGYNVTIKETTRELTGKEKVALKLMQDTTSIDDMLDGESSLSIDVDVVALIHVHNEKSDNAEYDVCIIKDKGGNMYKTSSESFISVVFDIIEDMEDVDEEWTLKVFKKPSNNFKGKFFITATVE